MHTTIPADQSPTMGWANTAVFVAAVASIVGTGTTYDLSRIDDWEAPFRRCVSLVVDKDSSGKDEAARPDLRTAAEHLANIREVLNPSITDLASVLGVSRQAIYKWLGKETNPEQDKLERVRELSRIADAFRHAGVSRATALLKMKVFDGRSLMDLISTGELRSNHIDTLIAEAQAMDLAYSRSGLARTKAKATTDWQSHLSIPGSPE
ncbi:MAG: hypothetical protein PHO89_08565 [Methylacidiphilaceae bacterium]|nr:hypothetical protein [Candidatus Methylacidiphilaceae bacterium]